MLYIIVTGGPLPDEAADLIRRYSVQSEDTVIIGCDGGCDFLAQHGLIPHLALGDMDSISEDGIRFLEDNHIFVERYPVEKDWTDTEIALGKTEDSDEVLIVCPVTGRIDHVIANLQLMLNLRSEGRRIFASDGISFCYPLAGSDGDSVDIDIKDMQKQLSVSLVPWDFSVPVKGVSTKGLYYALENQDLTAGKTLSFSNHPLKGARSISVSVKSGMLLVIVTEAV